MVCNSPNRLLQSKAIALGTDFERADRNIFGRHSQYGIHRLETVFSIPRGVKRDVREKN